MHDEFHPIQRSGSHDYYWDNDRTGLVPPNYVYNNDVIEILWPCGAMTKHKVTVSDGLAYVNIPMSSTYIPVEVRRIPGIKIRKSS